MPILDSWDASPPEDFPNYPALGLWGPEAVNAPSGLRRPALATAARE